MYADGRSSIQPKKLIKYGRKPLKSMAKAMQNAQKGKEGLALPLNELFGVKPSILSHAIYFGTSPL